MPDGFGVSTGQNYIINQTHIIPANSTQTFTFDLTGLAGRVRLTQITKSDTRTPINLARDVGHPAPFDLLVERLTVERFDATRPQDIIIDGEPPLDEIVGNGGGLPALLAAIELLQARSRIQFDIRNTTPTDIQVSITFAGYSLYEEDAAFSMTERGHPQETM
jgi:hypothetical protein